MMKKRNQRRRGFTLIELMIVIAIIGVLAAIAVPNFRRARERANQRACYANQKTIAGALEMYNLDNNTSVTQLDLTLLKTLVSAGYLQSVPHDPGQGGEATAEDYKLTEGTEGQGMVYCTAHGGIQDNPGGG